MGRANQKEVEKLSQEIGGRNILIVHEGDLLFYSATMGKEDVKNIIRSILLDMEIEDETTKLS
jgi:hypothetical protein